MNTSNTFNNVKKFPPSINERGNSIYFFFTFGKFDLSIGICAIGLLEAKYVPAPKPSTPPISPPKTGWTSGATYAEASCPTKRPAKYPPAP